MSKKGSGVAGYTTLEVMFCHWQWVRKWSGALWIRLKKPGYSWIKLEVLMRQAKEFRTNLTPEDFTRNPDYEVEDWRKA